MKHQILTFVLVALATLSFSQTNKNIIVNHIGSNVAYADLESAIAGAADGATIYVPGGIHTFGTEVIIDKELHFKGDGHYALTLAGTVPQISGQSLTLKRGSNNSSFEGIYFSNQVQLSHATTDITGDFHLLFRRCKIDKNIESFGGNSTIGNIDIYLNECVFKGMELNSCIDAVFVNNCIITGSDYTYIDQGYIYNSILLSSLQLSYIGNSYNINIYNSILYGSISQGNYSGNNTISYCLLKTCSSITPYVASSNIIYDDWVNIFENAPNNSFSQGNDYHLKAGCLGIGAGSGGIDVGIYGGANPWKEYSIPATPNVYFKSVTNQNNSEGNIDATYKVKAQSN